LLATPYAHAIKRSFAASAVILILIFFTTNAIHSQYLLFYIRATNTNHII
jgi:hypothetical protein